jgi:GntR family transcriptional regulator
MSYIRHLSALNGQPSRLCCNAAMPEPRPQPRRCRARRAEAARASFSPLYQQIKGLLLRACRPASGSPGEAIPSEMDLAARFKVSQGTVRKAIDELAADNLLVRRQGKGTFVATHAEQQTSTASCA